MSAVRTRIMVTAPVVVWIPAALLAASKRPTDVARAHDENILVGQRSERRASEVWFCTVRCHVHMQPPAHVSCVLWYWGTHTCSVLIR
jgi:hypothetical protein